ncbi:MAG: ABC transporter substrate-binding protein [Methanomassiliicoccaceae archaeon]|nr:ABC transporter substrate-binding protein [Methanomassiliicoccaceae archaeon]
MERIKIMAIIAVVAIIVAGAAIFIIGADNSENSDGSVTVTDYLGREVTIDSTERIISTSVVPTAILCGLGVSSNIVGVSSDAGVYAEDPYVIGLTNDDFPKAITDGMNSGRITPLGGMYRMSAETIATVESDIVVCDSYGINQEIMDALDVLGIKYIVASSASSLEEIYDNIQLLGKAFGKEQAAERMISEMKSVIKKICDWCESIVDNELKGQKYNVALMMTGTYAIGPNYTGGDTLEALSVYNAFESIERYAAVSKESIASVNPDVIIYQNLEMGTVTSPADVAVYVNSIYTDPVLGNISAAENERIFATAGGAKNSTSYYSQGIVRAYAIYAMFIYKDFMTFDVPDVLDSDNYAQYTQQFWEMINS